MTTIEKENERHQKNMRKYGKDVATLVEIYEAHELDYFKEMEGIKAKMIDDGIKVDEVYMQMKPNKHLELSAIGICPAHDADNKCSCDSQDIKELPKWDPNDVTVSRQVPIINDNTQAVNDRISRIIREGNEISRIIRENENTSSNMNNIRPVNGNYKPMTTEEVKQVIQIGSMVKIRRNAERFWNKVHRISKKGVVFATVANDLTNSPKKIGDPIYFKIEDIIDVQ